MGRAADNRDEHWGAKKQRRTAQIDPAAHQDEPDIVSAVGEISIIAEERDFLVADKPAFLPSTPNGRLVRNTVQQRLRELRSEPDIVAVHRLDRLTSGMLLLSRTPETRSAYQQLFQAHQIRKVYECLTVMPDDWAAGETREVDLYLRNVAGQRGVEALAADTLADGAPGDSLLDGAKLARSTVTFLGAVAADIGDVFAPPRFIASEIQDPAASPPQPSLLNLSAAPSHGAACSCPACGSVMQVGHWRIEPHTGRTHQIRATMNHLGYPILGEDTYPDSIADAEDVARMSPVLRLMATELSFMDPLDGQQRVFQSGRKVTDLGSIA